MNTFPGQSSSTRNTGAMPSCEAAVECLAIDCGALPAAAEVARFRGADGVMECHVTVRLTGGCANPQICLVQAYHHALAASGLDESSLVFKRIFCSDVVNQADMLVDAAETTALSIIGQAPLPSAKFALWAYHLCDPAGKIEKSVYGKTLSCRRGGLTHHWTTGLIDPKGTTSHVQTRRVIESYDAWLHANGMSTADHVVRTWWFVRNIDADYHGLVQARCDFFDTHGLTADTHYIASTGIAGAHPEVAARVSLDSYAIAGLSKEQVEYLCAPDHLCPTHDYGVTFERATAVSYADRRQVFVSGTASIDHTGKILHQGDVIRQLDRTLENIEALLAKAGANLGDLAVILVYLRDPADAAAIEAILDERMGTVAYVMVDAPVCRPGWLIEIEGIAIVPCHRPGLPAF